MNNSVLPAKVRNSQSHTCKGVGVYKEVGVKKLLKKITRGLKFSSKAPRKEKCYWAGRAVIHKYRRCEGVVLSKDSGAALTVIWKGGKIMM